ncbi:MAG: malate dehydrogenase [Candidatus Omnitrophica bacterium]|nr:malate dehydrogenase [Candidatus Omnitrophota bacterium]
MKISVIGAGNVGSLTAMRLAEQGAGEVCLVDIAARIARGKACDMLDASFLLKHPYRVYGSNDIAETAGSDLIVVTAGLARKPGMSREELLQKNGVIVKGICEEIKSSSPDAVLIMVTNPLDLMTNLALRVTGFSPRRVMGMGISLDAARFAQIISEYLNIACTDIEPCVIGSHGAGMMPLARFTRIKGVPLDECVDEDRAREIVSRTVNRGAEIVSYLGTGSAFFAPSAAAAALSRAVLKDEKRVIGVCARLAGEYGIDGVCIGVPCRIGRGGIEQVIELELQDDERRMLQQAAESIKKTVNEI